MIKVAMIGAGSAPGPDGPEKASAAPAVLLLSPRPEPPAWPDIASDSHSACSVRDGRTRAPPAFG